MTSSRTRPELGDLPSILWQRGTKTGAPHFLLLGLGTPGVVTGMGESLKSFFSAGSFLPTALEQFGGLRPQRLAWLPNGQVHGSQPCCGREGHGAQIWLWLRGLGGGKSECQGMDLCFKMCTKITVSLYVIIWELTSRGLWHFVLWI